MDWNKYNQIYKKDLAKQLICFLESIHFPKARKYFFNQSRVVDEKCRQFYINIFVLFDSFHIVMSYFHLLEKWHKNQVDKMHSFKVILYEMVLWIMYNRCWSGKILLAAIIQELYHTCQLLRIEMQDREKVKGFFPPRKGQGENSEISQTTEITEIALEQGNYKFWQ